MSCDRSWSFSQTLTSLFITVSLWNFSSSISQAQIIPDNSLDRENSIVTPQDGLDLIEGGAIRDSNLFHSFSEFNIPNGGNVYFANPENVINILTRVTGNNASNILGTLGVNGDANLFLLNPNGIVFGENAALDINGSFLATTAESYLFENDFAYSATNPEAPPLLTVNIPVGLQMGNNAAAINIEGNGHNLTFDADTLELNRNNRPTGLEVDSGNTLALIGGEINLTGGNLTAQQGRIELGSVENGNVSLIPAEDGFSFSYEAITAFQDINLTQSASIDVSGNGGGNLQLQGNNISLSDLSTILANTTGTENGGNTQITAAENLSLIGINEVDLDFSSSILSEVEVGATGNAGNIAIAAKNIELFDPNSAISTTVYGDGKGGNITLETENLRLIDGGNLVATIFGKGDGGAISVNATGEVEVSGITPGDLPVTQIATGVASVEATGNAGNLTINGGNRFIVKDGGQIASGTLGGGNAGNLTINASEIEIRDGFIDFDTNVFIATALFSGSEAESTGEGGDIILNSDRLLVTGDFSFLRSATIGTADAGDIIINSDFVLFTNGGRIESATAGDTGDAGDIIINSDRLFVQNGAVINLSTFGAGNGGDIAIDASEIEISSDLPPSNLSNGIIITGVGETATGDAGDIIIKSDRLLVGDNGNIASETSGIGNGGNIIIETAEIQLLTGGDISSNAFSAGNAGNIEIQANNISIDGVFSMGEESIISAFSSGNSNAGSININTNTLNLSNEGTISVSNLNDGDSGNLNITATELNIDNFATIEAEVNNGDRGNINLATDNVFINNNSTITATATGTSTGGNLTINNTENIVLLNNSQIIADAIEGNGGNINLDTIGFFVSPNSLISASSEFGLDGNIAIETPENDPLNSLEELPVNLLDRTNQIIAGCPAKDGANFAVIGRGGLPENPSQNITESIWLSAWETSVESDKNPTNITITKQKPKERSIVEAQSWKINGQGKVELISSSYSSNLSSDRVDCY